MSPVITIRFPSVECAAWAAYVLTDTGVDPAHFVWPGSSAAQCERSLDVWLGLVPDVYHDCLGRIPGWFKVETCGKMGALTRRETAFEATANSRLCHPNTGPRGES